MKARQRAVAALEAAHPSQAFSEDGTACVWLAKSGLDVQLHLAQVPGSCWVVPWQDPAGEVPLYLSTAARRSRGNPITGLTQAAASQLALCSPERCCGS